MRVLFAGGGTGGHINPAISIANYIKEKDNNFEALFVGTMRGLEKKLVPEAGYNIEYIDISGFDRRNLLKNFSVLKKLIKSRKDSVKIIKDFKPDVVVATGGYVSGPVLMAAAKLGVPSIIHEQNVYPGLTVKGSEKYVDYVAVSFSETLNHMNKPEKCIVTGNPIRGELLKVSKTDAREKLGLSEKPFVLVFGGSLGAQKINNAMVEVIKKLGNESPVTLYFGTGDRNYQNVMESFSGEKISEDIKILPYISNMAEVMAASDLVVCRSGAITLSEVAALKKPSILIPSPNVVRNHQEQNAREYEKAGGAFVLTEDKLTGDVLYEKIMELSADEGKLSKMSENVKKLAKTDALEKIYELIEKIKIN